MTYNVARANMRWNRDHEQLTPPLPESPDGPSSPLKTELASGSVRFTVSVVVILAAWLFVIDLILEYSTPQIQTSSPVILAVSIARELEESFF